MPRARGPIFVGRHGPAAATGLEPKRPRGPLFKMNASCAHGHLDRRNSACRRCEYGWTGQRCRLDTIPACRARDGTVDSCVVRKVLPCDCVRQCISAGAFAAHLREPYHKPVCNAARGRGQDGGVGTLFYWSLQNEQFAVGAKVDGPEGQRARPHFSPPAHRRHDLDYESSTCYLNCSYPRGTCLRGSCACNSPFFGGGCVFPRDRHGRLRRRPGEGALAHAQDPRLRVYVYDLPPIVTARRSWASDWDGQRLFWTAQQFASTLLADDATVTDDPTRAHLFVVPYAGTNMEGLPEYYRHLQKHIQTEYPAIWNRRDGRDHVWLCSADHGGNIMQSIPKVRDGIVLAHYFKGFVQPTSRHVVQAPNLLGATEVAREIYSSWGSTPQSFAEACGKEEAARTNTLFFAGNLNLADKVGFYSEGVRQALWHHHHDQSGFKIVPRSPTYKLDYRTHQFCAAPLGEGWGIRLTWALAHACIPVVFASEVQSFWSGLQSRSLGTPVWNGQQVHAVPEIYYDQFAVVVEKTDIPRLHTILAAIGPAQRNRLRAGLHAYHRYFLWDSPYGLAYNVTLLELCLRARLHAGTLRCSGHVDAASPFLANSSLAAAANFERYTAVREREATLANREDGRAEPIILGRLKPRRARVAASAPANKTGDRAAIRVHCSAECSAHEELFAQIDADLALWPHGIDKQTTDDALKMWPENGIFASLMVLDGHLYKLRPHYSDGRPVIHSDPMLYGTLKQIFEIVTEQREAGTPIPDVELIINADDYGRPKLRDRKVLPLLSITKKLGLGADILYPTGHYLDWTNHKGGKLLGLRSETYRYPWHLKREIAFFRGRPNTHTTSRYALPRMVNGSAHVDMGLVWYNAEHDRIRRADPSIPPLGLAKEVTMQQHGEFKYLISLDGNSYSHRLLKLLAINSVVIKEETADVEFYYHLLKPHVHYVPFEFKMTNARNLKTARSNLLDVVRMAMQNDAAMRRVAEQAHALVHTHLCHAARRCYLHELLRRYGRKMTYKPALTDRPGAIQVTKTSQLWTVRPIKGARDK